MINDPFRPKNDPARAIYDCFQVEAAKRGDKLEYEWRGNERVVVFVAATTWCHKHPDKVARFPTMEMVKRAEEYAMGHADYGAKWAYHLADQMTEP